MSFSLHLSIVLWEWIVATSETPSWLAALGFGMEYIGQLTVLFIFTMRLDYTFRDTLIIFAYKRSIIILLYCLVYIEIILFFIALIIFYVFDNNNWSILVASIIGVLSILLYITNYIALSVMFCKKLNALMNYRVRNRNHDRNDTSINDNSGTSGKNNNSNSNVGMHDTKNSTYTDTKDRTNTTSNSSKTAAVLVEISSIESLVRYSLSTIIACLSTVLCNIIALSRGFANSDSSSDDGNSSNNNELDGAGLGEFVFSIDALINAFCIFLLFSFSDKIYYKLCHYLDKMIKHYFVKQVIKQNKNQPGLQSTKDFHELLTLCVINLSIRDRILKIVYIYAVMKKIQKINGNDQLRLCVRWVHLYGVRDVSHARVQLSASVSKKQINFHTVVSTVRTCSCFCNAPSQPTVNKKIKSSSIDHRLITCVDLNMHNDRHTDTYCTLLNIDF